MSDEGTKSPNAVLVGGAQEFAQAVLNDIESVFRNQYGPKWTPEAQAVFQSLREACIGSAIACDNGVSRDAIKPLQAIVHLTNYVERGR